jgi:hypothetical protein
MKFYSEMKCDFRCRLSMTTSSIFVIFPCNPVSNPLIYKQSSFQYTISLGLRAVRNVACIPRNPSSPFFNMDLQPNRPRRPRGQTNPDDRQDSRSARQAPRRERNRDHNTEHDNDGDRLRRRRPKERYEDETTRPPRRRPRSLAPPTDYEDDDDGDGLQPSRPRRQRQQEDETERPRRNQRQQHDETARPRRQRQPTPDPDEDEDDDVPEEEDPEPSEPSVDSEDDQHIPPPRSVDNSDDDGDDFMPPTAAVPADMTLSPAALAEANGPRDSGPGLVRRLTRQLGRGGSGSSGRSRRNSGAISSLLTPQRETIVVGSEAAPVHDQLARAMAESRRQPNRAAEDTVALQRALAESERQAREAQQRTEEDDSRALREAMKASERADKEVRRREEEERRREEDMLEAVMRESIEAEERVEKERRARLEEQRRLLVEYGGDVEGGGGSVAGTTLPDRTLARSGSSSSGERTQRTSAPRPERRRTDSTATPPGISRSASTANATSRASAIESQRRERPSVAPVGTSPGPLRTASTRAANAHRPRASSGLAAPPITAEDIGSKAGTIASPRSSTTPVQGTINTSRRPSNRRDSILADGTQVPSRAPRPVPKSSSVQEILNTARRPSTRRDIILADETQAPSRAPRPESSRGSRPHAVSLDASTAPQPSRTGSNSRRNITTSSSSTPRPEREPPQPQSSSRAAPARSSHQDEPPPPSYETSSPQPNRPTRTQSLVEILTRFDEDSPEYIAAIAALDRETMAEADIADTGLDDVDRAPSYEDHGKDERVDERLFTSDNWWKTGGGKKQEVPGGLKRADREVQEVVERGLREREEAMREGRGERVVLKPIGVREMQGDVELVNAAVEVTEEEEAEAGDVMGDLTRGEVERTLMARVRERAPGNTNRALDVGDEERTRVDASRRAMTARLNMSIAPAARRGGERRRR